MNNSTKLERSFIYYTATIFFFAVGGITTLGLHWYANLAKPTWAPTETVVAILWFALFLATAVSASLFWERSKREEASFNSVISTYMANAVLVLVWDYLFFGTHTLVAAFWVAVAVGISVLLLIVRLWKEIRTASLLLLPYLAWMVFALLFTHAILLLNP